MIPHEDTAIELSHVFETYELEIKTEAQVIRESFAALKDVSLFVKKGEALAIIGPNGAGKSTLLRILAGLLRPEKGDVRINGRVSSLLDLGAGFHPELTGRDNLLLNASLYNFSRDEMHNKLEQVLQFADIGKFIDVPVRCYSQGMYVRLAFSLAIHVDPDILLIDDCLAVGDDNFRLKSLDKVLEFRARNKTIVFVTHDFGSARQVCGRGVYLREGVILKDGDLDDVVESYVSPLSDDKRRYKYLGAKIVEEEDRVKEGEIDRQKQDQERHRLEQEAWRQEQAERNRVEQEVWRQEQAERNRVEQESWRHEQAERNRVEQEAWRHEQAERNRDEQESWRKEQAERNRLELEAWQMEHAGRSRAEQDKAYSAMREEFYRQEELRKAQQVEQESLRHKAEEDQRKMEQARRDDQRARRKASVELKGAHGLRVVVAPARVQVFLHEQELTDEEGIRTLFNKGKFIDFSSTFVNWWVIKVSDTRVICLLRWDKSVHVSQVWRWSVMPDGSIGLEIDTKSLDGQPMENLRVECRLKGKRTADGEGFSTQKRNVMSFGEKNNIAFSARQDDQVTGSYLHGENKETLYFLGVCEERSFLPQGSGRRNYSFKGMFSGLGKAESPVVVPDLPVSRTLVQDKLKFVFTEGRGVLSWNEKALSAGMGLYTSLYSRGVWYDSAQARWSIMSDHPGKLVVKGRWPWVPVVQVWNIELISDSRIALDLRMRVLRGFPIKVYESVLMLDTAYRQWAVDDELHSFPSDVTHDDFFRICLLSRNSDGKNSISLGGKDVPSLAFTPGSLPGQRIVLENAGHIAGKETRLLHCLMIHDQQDHFVKEGEYDLFKGHIDIGGGDT